VSAASDPAANFAFNPYANTRTPQGTCGSAHGPLAAAQTLRRLKMHPALCFAYPVEPQGLIAAPAAIKLKSYSHRTASSTKSVWSPCRRTRS
jgi:hypothetical protein